MSLLLTGALTFALYGCPDDGDSPDASTGADAGRDGGVVSTDAEPADSGPADTGAPDAGPADTGSMDAQPTPQAITFIHTNDEHSHFLGFGPNVDDFPDLSTSADISGGIYRRAAVLRTLELDATRAGDPVVTVSAGDVPMGSLFHIANLVQSPDYIAQTLLGYDVMTLGNHEFDFGPGVLASMISQGSISATGTPQPLRIPLVVSNIRFSMSSPDDDALAALWGPDNRIRRTWVRDFGDVKVGFVGVVGLDAAVVAPFKSPVMFSLAVDTNAACTGDGDCPGSVCVPPADDPTAAAGHCAIDSSGFDVPTNFPALVADIASAVAELRGQGVDLVVAISHSGVSETEINTLQMMGLGLENAVASEEIVLARGVDMALTQANIPGIDLIVGGHSHTALQAPLEIPNARSGITTHIVQAGQYGEWVGKVRLTRDDVTEPWALDADASGLTKVDGTVDTSGVDRFFLDSLVFGVMDALEQTPLAQAGDGLLFPGEQCDTGPNGLVLPGGGQCSAVFPGSTGTLACHPNRQLDLSNCTLPMTGAPSCGDNSTNLPEQCDGTSLPVDCAGLGYVGGNIACANNCTLDVSGCTVRFPSLMEAAVNFARPSDETPIVFSGTRGSLFFHSFGTAGFDVGARQSHNESNVLNLVADADRYSANLLALDGKEPPIDVVVVANGVVRDGLYAGTTGSLSMADLFRVVPLGVSPQESTPGFTLVDFYLAAPEVKAALEIGLSTGLTANSFWLGVSGARVEYDLSLPAFDPSQPLTTGRVTKIELISKGQPWDDTNAFYEQPLFDAANGGFPNPNRLLRVSTNLYVELFAAALGICPRDSGGAPFPHCAACTDNADCTVTGSRCDTVAGICRGGEPPAFSARTTVPIGGGFRQELKEFLALASYIRRLPNDTLPANYSEPVPRRMCCVGSACPTDNSRTCPQMPQ